MDDVVTLREITSETVRRVTDLEVAPEQRGFVAPNAVSIAEAHFAPGHWMRAIYADGQPVGFVLTFDDPSEVYRRLLRDDTRGRTQYTSVLLTKAIIRLSGDHDGTLIVPWPPYR